MNDRSSTADRSLAPEGCQAASGAPAGTAGRILSLSLALFAQRGYAATGMRDIAQACSLTPGAIYNHFASKEDVLAAIVGETYTSLLAVLEVEAEEAAAAGDAPVDAFERLLRAFARHVVERPAASYASERDFVQLSPERRRPVEEQRAAILAVLEEGLERAMAAGELALPAAGPHGTRRVVTSIANLLTGLAEARGDELAAADELVELHVGLALRGLAPARA